MTYTIKEIAERAGVSKSTVSRVISGKGYASPQAREKVLSVIKLLQYKPNAVARAMVSQRTNNIGVIIYREQMPIVSHPFYGKILDAILDAAAQLHYSVIVTTDREMSLRSADYMMEKRVDGLILISRLRHNVVEYIKSFGVPYLMVNGSTEDKSVVHLVNRDRKGGRMAGEYYVQCGHRSICILAGPQEHRSHYLRLNGFLEQLKDLGADAENDSIYFSGNSSFESGYRVMEERWTHFQKKNFSALFATNDMLAMGAMKFLAEQGVRVPEQLSVMGFDDTDPSSLIHPALTTIRVEKTRMGSDAVILLDRLIQGEELSGLDLEYEPELVVRDSTGCFRN